MESQTRSETGGRIPPQDLDAEKSVLGALMLNNDDLPEILTILRIVIESAGNAMAIDANLGCIVITHNLTPFRNDSSIFGEAGQEQNGEEVKKWFY